MLSIIKTAIITITISFISGVLLDYYKNYAPRIVCNMGRTKVIKRDNKKEKVYFLTIRNVSKKTIHDINVNITANCNNLKLHDSKITTGLRYDILKENNVFNISVPFLSKNDEFSTKVLLEVEDNIKVKPIISLRSPENFKRIDKSKVDYYKAANREKNSDRFEEIFFRNKKVIIGVLSVLIIAFAGILAKEYYIKLADDKRIYENNNPNNILNSPSTTVSPEINSDTTVPVENNKTNDTTGSKSNGYDNYDSSYWTTPNTSNDSSGSGDISATQSGNDPSTSNSNGTTTDVDDNLNDEQDTNTDGNTDIKNNEDKPQNGQSSQDEGNDKPTDGEQSGGSSGNEDSKQPPKDNSTTDSGNNNTSVKQVQ